MTEQNFPNEGAFDIPVTPGDFDKEDFALQQGDLLEATRNNIGNQGTPPTIAPVSGVLTPVSAISFVDTEGGSPTDDVVDVVATNFRDGQLCILKCKQAAHVVTFKEAYLVSGSTPSNWFVMDDLGKSIVLIKEGAAFRELDRSGPFNHGTQLLIPAESFTVPPNVYSLTVTAVSGGGGGGGGAGGGTTPAEGQDGDDGTAGTLITFKTVTVLGGALGRGGKADGGGGGHGTVGTIDGGHSSGLIAGLGGNSPFTILGVYGRGGAGGNGSPGNAALTTGGGGASGGINTTSSGVKKAVSVTPGESITVVGGLAGIGGSGGAGAIAGDDGTDGIPGAVLVEW